MTQLLWDQVGEKVFESGSDRGVLYLPGRPGVVWNGLVSVTEKSSGGETSEYYFDGNKYMDLVANEDYQATIEAFTYPDEFLRCDGTLSVKTGLFTTRQPRSRFGLSYRTKIGNDLVGAELAYKLHLVYNALASTTEKAYASATTQVDPSNFSWTINCVPERIPGFKPSAHLVLDSRTTDPLLLQSIEEILYGNEDNDPRLPTPTEVVELYDNWQASIVILDNGDGTWTAIGPDELITMLDSETFQIDGIDATYLDAVTYEISTTV